MSGRRWSGFRFGAVIAVGIAGLLVLGVPPLRSMHDRLRELHQHRLSTVTELAASVVHGRYEQALRGEISPDRARALAAEDVSGLRFERGHSFWIIDRDGVLIADPRQPDRIGTSLLGVEDADGTPIYRASIAAVERGADFVEGRWPGPDSGERGVRRPAHVRLVEPWEWVVGTHPPADDVDAALGADRRRLAALIAAYAVVAGSLAVFAYLSVPAGGRKTETETETVPVRQAPAGTGADTGDDLGTAVQAVRHQIVRTAQALEAFRNGAIEELRSAGGKGGRPVAPNAVAPAKPPRSGNRWLAALVCLTALALVLQSVDQSKRTEEALRAADNQIYAMAADLAASVLHRFEDTHQRGTRTLEEAQREALQVLTLLRFDGTNYILTLDLSGVVIAHPVAPELDGNNIYEVSDIYGVPLVQELIAAARSGGGFVTYNWPRPGLPGPNQKSAYAAPFEPWGWLVVAAGYTDGQDRTLSQLARSTQLRLVASLVVLVLVGIAAADRRRTAAPADRAIRARSA